MSSKGVSIRKMKEMLRLYYDAELSMHKIARSINLSSGIIHKYITQLKANGITWPIPEGMSDEKLLSIAQTNSKEKVESIDFQSIHTELKRKGVTLQLLWEEYTEAGLLDISYSQLTRRYKAWRTKQPLSMRQNHKAGDKVFVDYSGQTFDIIDPDTNQVRTAQIFIGVLGASNYTYAEATWSQQLEDWIRSHIRMFDYFGGVTSLIVPDNLKSAIHKSCKYEPDANPTYAEFVRHYSTAVLPARPYKPKDKAKAEGGVLLVQRWILARLRNETFVGLDELNRAIRKLLKALNSKSFKKLPGSRQSLFEEIDKPALKPLPTVTFEYKHYKRVKVHVDYHFELERHFYSVPSQYIGEYLDIWYNNHVVEAFKSGKSLAMHIKSDLKGKHTTNKKHMPNSHRKQSQWSAERFINWGKSIGKHTQLVVAHLLKSRDHEEQAFRACLGLLSLAKKYSDEKLELACHYAIEHNIRSYRSVKSILNKELYLNIELNTIQSEPVLDHENIRGSRYYH